MRSKLRAITIAIVLTTWGALHLEAAGQSESSATTPSGDAGAAQPGSPKDAGEKQKEPAADESASATPPEGPAEQGAAAVKAYQSQEWALLVGLILMLLGSLLRLAMGFKWEFWKSSAGGYTIAALSGLSAFGYAMVEGGGFSLVALTAGVAALSTAMAWAGPTKKLVTKMAGK